MSARALAEADRAAHRVAADRAHLVAGLEEFAGDGVRVAGPAEGPFVLLGVPGATAVRRRLRDLGFAVRRGDTFPGLGEDWLRVAVRDRGTVNAFLQALDRALTSLPDPAAPPAARVSSCASPGPPPLLPPPAGPSRPRPATG